MAAFAMALRRRRRRTSAGEIESHERPSSRLADDRRSDLRIRAELGLRATD